jgi:carnitine 3-dehydrogenase
MGFGLRWGQMGLFETYRVAGGEAGMKHFMAQFGPCLSWPWTKLMDVPEFNDELVDLDRRSVGRTVGQYTIRELERIRDSNLIGFLRVLKDRNWGAGKVLKDHDKMLAAQLPAPPKAEAMVMAHMQVLPGWIDYNGHMTESRYLFAGSETCDNFLRLIGADMDYVKGGHSYYTAESHIMHLGEAKLGDRLTGTLQVLHADEKRMHIFTRILRGEEVRGDRRTDAAARRHEGRQDLCGIPCGARQADADRRGAQGIGAARVGWPPRRTKEGIRWISALPKNSR